ncbi:hypothetical protein CEP54_010869 [Fusarium duplospermum]|uniref:Metallo-beta-lactamase domain-containing protein n=1 Tax=Fusarium duplospermum TaxID=1325734 RepID=A0A428PHP7_9HYPO|nr:hypothetical protein CEP54_010869 [Fusarium duplospermum]
MISLRYASLLALAFARSIFGQPSSPSSILLLEGLEALGGIRNLEFVADVSYSGGGSMAQTFGLNGLDRILAGAGRQNVSFSFEGGVLKQRIERFHDLSVDFLWARPNLEPLNFSLVVQNGGDGFAATVAGNDVLLAPRAPSQGYKDGMLAAYLMQEAVKMSPVLLRTIFTNDNHTLRMERTTDGKEHQAIYDETLDISVLLDEVTHLPYIIRSYETHNFFGPSTNDLFLRDYVSVEGVKFPRRLQTIYNNKHLLTDYTVANISVNTMIPAELFDGPVERLEAHAPRRDNLYGFAEIGETNALYRWTGMYTGTMTNFNATQPWKDLPGVWLITVNNAPGYRQLVLEIGRDVIVLDAPPHQSHLVIHWVENTLKKSVTHVWPTHHHHDHAYGIVDYVAAGAKVIALKDAVGYYSTIPKDRFITYSTDRPLTVGDDQIQVSFVHMKESVHATDQSYAHIVPRCPSANSTALIFDADDVNPAEIAASEQGTLMAALNQFAADKAALSATFVAVHGDWIPFSRIINVTGFRYPHTTAQDFKHLRSKCHGSKKPDLEAIQGADWFINTAA